jgi:hypothetical protein
MKRGGQQEILEELRVQSLADADADAVVVAVAVAVAASDRLWR